jgi:hypothetical protein
MISGWHAFLEDVSSRLPWREGCYRYGSAGWCWMVLPQWGVLEKPHRVGLLFSMLGGSGVSSSLLWPLVEYCLSIMAGRTCFGSIRSCSSHLPGNIKSSS